MSKSIVPLRLLGMILLFFAMKCNCFSWIVCAVEGGICSRNDESGICYGYDPSGVGPSANDGRYFCNEFAPSDIMCSVVSFGGDPSISHFKSCWVLVNYNMIPNFDFSASDLASYSSLNLAEQNCLSGCIGFNTHLVTKYDFTNPVTSTYSFYIHPVQYGMKFVKLQNLCQHFGVLLAFYYVGSDAACVYKCTTTINCVGAIFVSGQYCSLMSSFGGSPFQCSNSNILLPVGPGYCPSSVSAAGNCIDPDALIPYTVIPHFDFTGSDIAVAGNPDLAEQNCQSDKTCVGFNSHFGAYKNGFDSPTLSQYNFYVHKVTYGMQFVQVSGWGIQDFLLSFITTFKSVSDCAYRCTITSGCVGAIWSTSNYCFLKSSFGAAYQDNDLIMLLPVGPGGCPISVVIAGNCVNSIPYTVIPNFDFIGNEIALGTSLASAEQNCQSNQLCIGFNSGGSSKNNFNNPVVSTTTNFYIHTPAYGMQFIQLLDWFPNDIQVTFVIFRKAKVLSDCAYQCSITSGCVATIYYSFTCFMQSSFGILNYVPGLSSIARTIIPAGPGGCPASIIAAGNCLSSIPYTMISNFDFANNEIALANSLDSAQKNCEYDQSCIGFNSFGSYKNNFNNPTISQSTNTFVHAVAYGMQFVQLVGWDCSGTTLPLPNDIFIQTAAQCVYYCTITKLCAGALWRGDIHGCILKSSFIAPQTNALYNLLLPVGNSGCPATVISAGNCITPSPVCSPYLPEASLMSLLIYAEPTFLQMSKALTSDPLSQDYFNNGKSYLESFLNTEVDFNGDSIITTKEVFAALNYRSVSATGLGTNFVVWNCKNDFNGCNSSSVNKARIYDDAIHCFLNSPKHLFDCSGVSIIVNLQSQFPQSDDNAVCQLSDQSWRTSSYQKPHTSWAYDPPSTVSGQSSIGFNGKVCIYTNGYNIAGSPFNTNEISEGIVSEFIDPNNNGNVTSYRRIYCIAVTLNSGSYSYECSIGLFHVSKLFCLIL